MISDVLRQACQNVAQHLFDMPTIYRDAKVCQDILRLQADMDQLSRKLATKVEPPAEQRAEPEPDYPTREAALWYFGKLHPEERFMLLSWALVNAALPSENHPRRDVICKRLVTVNETLERMVARHHLETELEGTITHWMVRERRRIAGSAKQTEEAGVR